MTFEQKLVTITSVLKETYKLSDELVRIINNNILERRNLYGNQTINTNDPSIFNTPNGYEDLLLNRLVNNIRDYEFDNVYNKENSTKGTYTSAYQKLYMADKNFIKDKINERFQGRIQNVTDSMLEECYEKVINHEIGHALQTGFTSNNGTNNSKYEEVVNKLHSINPNVFSKSSIMSTTMDNYNRGMVPVRRQDQYSQVRNYYCPLSFTTHLDEIFNEEEALKVTGMVKPQLSYDMGQGFSKNIYNYDSSNYRITSYATLMKIVMGKERTCKAMYNDSIEAYVFFDQFMDSSKKIYKGSKYENNTPMINVLNSLDVIKNARKPEERKNALQESIKLENFLTNCYYNKITSELANNNLEETKINEILKELKEFKSVILNNPNQELFYQKKLNELENILKHRLESIDNSKSNNDYQPQSDSKLNETEKQEQINLLTYEEIQKKCSNYKIENGNVIDKNTNSIVKNEEIILKVKASFFIFREAKEDYKEMIRIFGKTSKSQETFIKKSMENYSVNNEVNNFGTNKLVNKILSSNGHYEEFMSGKDLANSKFSMLVPPKREYGLALLKLKFREKCLDIENLKISLDLSELQKNGVSKVIIDFKIKKFEKPIESTESKTQESNNSFDGFQHPKATELNELEKMKKNAKQDNDEVAYTYAQKNIVSIVEKNRISVTPEQWNSMNIEAKMEFVNLKMREAKILNDRDEFDYWNTNFKKLQETKIRLYEILEVHQPQYNSAPSIQKKEENDQLSSPENNKDLNLSESVVHLRNKLTIVQNEYRKMMSDGYIDNEELKTLENLVERVINEGYSCKSFAKSKTDIKAITIIINSLEEEQQKLKKMKKDVIEETDKKI